MSLPDTSLPQSPALKRKAGSQGLLPFTKTVPSSDDYDMYPAYTLTTAIMYSGYDLLVDRMLENKRIIIDGYHGIDWSVVRDALNKSFFKKSQQVCWHEMTDLLKEEQEIEKLVKPFLGEPSSVWGRIASLDLADFYQRKLIDGLDETCTDDKLDILIGTGAALVAWDAPVIYFDLPKNEVQYRMRGGSITNIGSSHTRDPAAMYKRSYFVDWIVLNKHKEKILPRIEIIADGQHGERLNWLFMDELRKEIAAMVKGSVRVRQWFEPGAWGGQWLKQHVPGIPQQEINYAWSFELIVPENGVLFEQDGRLLEIAFDWLMLLQYESILGKDAVTFGTLFPIRFDFLDTFDGANLSIQCHPSLDYIREHFGEVITQDETYYILDAKEDASVYLGFKENIEPSIFREELELSQSKGTTVAIDKYIQRHPSRKHDFFLIPNGTVHSAGKNNLVLEISATPYIYTFKMYDWLQRDLTGNLRPINIDHAFRNLHFERKGLCVEEELISRPAILEQGDNWQLIHLPTHSQHFYDVHRIEFTDSISVLCNDQLHVLMLVEGTALIVETANGHAQRYHYAETFFIPAAAEKYTLVNTTGHPVKVIKAFIK